MSDFWAECLSSLSRTLPDSQFKTWVKPLTGEYDGDGHLTLVSPNPHITRWVRANLLESVRVVAEGLATCTIDVSCETLTESAQSTSPAENTAPEQQHANTKSQQQESKLQTGFTFANYVSGKANQMAVAAAAQVAENPGVAYNPLFIYGGTGLGKTHILHAIGTRLLETNPRAKVRYIHTEQFVTDVVSAYQNKSFDTLKRHYRNLDLLLIDDIQFFVGKSRSQEEFFYTFNALFESNKQVVLTSDAFPKEIQGIEERLKSRFSWGLTVSVEPPELEMRVAILIRKAEVDGFVLDESVAFFIAQNVRSNVRELEGALKRVAAFARFNSLPINLVTAKEALKDLLAVVSRQVSIDNIQRIVADYFKIKVSDMYSARRFRSVARPRQVAMALAKELTHQSLPEIGEAFGGRDHTTVLHACRKAAELRETDATFARDYVELQQILLR